MKIRLTNIPKNMQGVFCRKCNKLVSISKPGRELEALKAHVDLCMGYFKADADKEKARIDKEIARRGRD